MISHPDRDAIIQSIADKFAQRFEFVARMIDFWVYTDKDFWVQKSTLPIPNVRLAMTLDVQICRLFASVVEDCRRGEGITATIATRSMFESILALYFTTAKNVRIGAVAGKQSTNAQQQKFRAVSGPRAKELSAKMRPDVERRGLLYLAHGWFEQRRFQERCKTTKGLKRLANSKRLKIDMDLLDGLEQEIGSEWFSVLNNHPHTYSGLSVRELATCLRREFALYYEVLYSQQSRAVHGAEAFTHLARETDGVIRPQWFSSVGDLDATFSIAVALFFVTLRILQDHVGFGIYLETAMHSFRKEWLTMNNDS